MFEWILIGLELTFLYYGFWFVYIRTPRVHRIKADMWGSYETMHRLESHWERSPYRVERN